MQHPIIEISENIRTKEKSVNILFFNGWQMELDHEANIQETINICCKMIALSVFGNTSLKLFRIELEKTIKETITKKLGENYDPFQRKSTGDGT